MFSREYLKKENGSTEEEKKEMFQLPQMVMYFRR
jgi:hypothetical protein